jgi:hypothetical protein
MISITSYYGNGASSENNAKVVTLMGTKFYFSYETLVAIENEDGLIVHANEWGPTTGKHLNAIDGGGKEAKAERLSSSEFNDYATDLALPQAAKDMFVF